MPRRVPLVAGVSRSSLPVAARSEVEVVSRPVRRGSVFQLFLFALVAGGAAMTLALVPGWLPQPASREAGRIDFVFWFVTVICVAIFAIVAAVIVYSLLKFPARPGDHSHRA